MVSSSIFFFFFFFFFFFLLLFFLAQSQRSQSGCLPYFYTWCSLSAKGLKCAARGSLEIQDAKITQQIAISAPSRNFVGLYLRNYTAYIGNRKNVLSNTGSSTCLRNMVNFGPLPADIDSGVWGSLANFNGFRVLAALLHGTLVVGVSQTLRR